VEDRLKAFYEQATYLASHTRGKHIMWTMGSDFNYENGQSWFENMDALIRIVNADNKGFK
jgi:alpha-mannosidase